MAVVIGSGPNGLTAAILLARAGLRTTLYEAQPVIGGGLRSGELTLPGFTHDLCSTAHPMGISSRVFRQFPLEKFGLEWVMPTVPVAHPLDGGVVASADRSYRELIEPFAARWQDLLEDFLAPLGVPAHPLLFARFGLAGGWPATVLAKLRLRSPGARALFAGMAAHSILPLEFPGSAAFGVMLGTAAEAPGWPFVRGGSQNLANALAAYFESLGGRIVTNVSIRALNSIDDPGPILCDVSPRQFLEMAGSRLPHGYHRQLANYRYGPGVFKMDWALSQPIPWAASECAQAGTVHLGGSLEEVAASERAAWRGQVHDRPFVLLTQPTLFDPSRAPAGKHVAWAYCHVPNGCTADRTEAIEHQVERFAPGFRKIVLARHVMYPADLERRNANLIGGDIGGGAVDLKQLFMRPSPSLYRTPLKGVFLCSSSTPPGGGVHGMCGYNAVQAALRQ